MRIQANKTFINGRFVQGQILNIKSDRIESISAAKPEDFLDLNYTGDTYIIPGMIDLHIHGASGKDVMDASPDALATISTTLSKEGVTGFLATTMTESVQNIENALINVAKFIKTKPETGAELLGVHLEGPFLSQKFMGAQCGALFLPPDMTLLKKWQELSDQAIKIVTLAPELQGAVAFIESASKMNIVLSIGHTAATFAETEKAITAGATHATHLFNAMSGVHHREPGAASAILYDERVKAELIADGHHLSPAIIKLAAKCKGLANLILVTDAMRAKCLKNGEYTLGGQTVTLDNGAVRLKKSNVLAGSVLCLNQALRNFVKFTGYSLEECIPMVSSTPAAILKLENDIGILAPAKKANLVVLDSHLDVLMTMREGRIIYNRN